MCAYYVHICTRFYIKHIIIHSIELNAIMTALRVGKVLKNLEDRAPLYHIYISIAQLVVQKQKNISQSNRHFYYII